MMAKTKKQYKKYSTRRKRSRQKGGKLCMSSLDPRDIYTIDETKYRIASCYIYDQEGSNDIVIKKIGPVKWSGRETIEKELVAAKLASIHNVGPPVLYTTMCDDEKYPVGYIVMEKINGETLGNLETSLPAKDYEKLLQERKQLLDKLYDERINLYDKHLQNTMYGTTLSSPEPRLWIIDFGLWEISDTVIEKSKRRYFN